MDFAKIGTRKCPMPEVSKEKLLTLIDNSISVLSEQPSLLTLSGDYCVVGDLHGNIRDLVRIFALNEPPPKTKYVFLGDYVDRGENSIEVVSLLLSMLVSYKGSFYLLKGNHEISKINKTNGFYAEVVKRYDEELWERFNLAFTHLPIACVLNGSFLLVHGGIGPNVFSTDVIAKIPKPLDNMNLLTELLWSDPTTILSTFAQNSRGKGYLFGCIALRNFLKTSGLAHIIRSHQVCQSGFESFDGNRLITVFSSSNYGKGGNDGTVLKVMADGTFTPITFPPLPINESETTFKQIDSALIDSFAPIPSTSLKRRIRLLRSSGKFKSEIIRV